MRGLLGPGALAALLAVGALGPVPASAHSAGPSPPDEFIQGAFSPVFVPPPPGSYELPGAINLAGPLISNNGYPYQSTYSVSRAIATASGVSLTRSSQTVVLSERGDERYPTVTMFDLRLSKAFRFGGTARPSTASLPRSMR